MPISIFGFQALWSPYLMLTIAFLIVVYFLVTVAWRKDFKVSEPLKKSEATYFLLAMATFYIIKGTPIDLMGHIMFTYHMVQMAVMLLFLPILIIKGIPWWVWKVAIEAPGVKTIFNFLTKPLIAIFIFIFLFSFYHLPGVLDFIKLDETLHGTYTFILFLSAVFMYWPLIGIMPDGPKMKNIHRIGYIIANAVLITPACALIIFTNTPFYLTYTDGEAWLKAMELCVPVDTLKGLTLSGPELFSSMAPLADQQLGGVLMKIIQEIIFAVLITIYFFRWFREDRATADDVTEKALAEHQAKWHAEQAQRKQQLAAQQNDN